MIEPRGKAMASGPQYTVRDLVGYSAFFAGLIITFTIIKNKFDVHWIVQAIPAIIVGAGCYWLADLAYAKYMVNQSPKKADETAPPSE